MYRSHPEVANAIQVSRGDTLDTKHFCWVSLPVTRRSSLVERGMQGVVEKDPQLFYLIFLRNAMGDVVEIPIQNLNRLFHFLLGFFSRKFCILY